MADVLFVYLRDAQDAAETLAAEFERGGVRVAGGAIREEELSSCAAIVVLWSEQSSRSAAYLDAARLAASSGRAVVAQLSAQPLPAPLRGAPRFDLTHWSGAAHDERLDGFFVTVDRMVAQARARGATAPEAAAPAPAPTRSEPAPPPPIAPAPAPAAAEREEGRARNPSLGSGVRAAPSDRAAPGASWTGWSVSPSAPRPRDAGPPPPAPPPTAPPGPPRRAVPNGLEDFPPKGRAWDDPTRWGGVRPTPEPPPPPQPRDRERERERGRLNPTPPPQAASPTLAPMPIPTPAPPFPLPPQPIARTPEPPPRPPRAPEPAFDPEPPAPAPRARRDAPLAENPYRDPARREPPRREFPPTPPPRGRGPERGRADRAGWDEDEDDDILPPGYGRPAPKRGVPWAGLITLILLAALVGGGVAVMNNLLGGSEKGAPAVAEDVETAPTRQVPDFIAPDDEESSSFAETAPPVRAGPARPETRGESRLGQGGPSASAARAPAPARAATLGEPGADPNAAFVPPPYVPPPAPEPEPQPVEAAPAPPPPPALTPARPRTPPPEALPPA